MIFAIGKNFGLYTVILTSQEDGKPTGDIYTYSTSVLSRSDPALNSRPVRNNVYITHARVYAEMSQTDGGREENNPEGISDVTVCGL